MRQHVWLVVAICIAADVVLIGLGVSGLSVAIAANPVVLTVARIAGGAFLLIFAVRAAMRALRPAGLVASETSTPSKRSAAGTTLAISFLNPHSYMDIVLLGSVAATFGAGDVRWFVGGALVGSALWFAGLGFFARLLAPLLSSPRAWRILDGAIALSMAVLGVVLLAG